MKTYTLIGIILIVVAVAAFGYQGISNTTRERVVDLGPLQMTNTIPLSPVVGAVALIGGLVLLIGGRSRNI